MVVPLGVLEHISSGSEFNRNINWELLKTDNPILDENTNCLVVPILIHQHQGSKVVFPHFRCHIVIDGVSHLLLQDLSFEQWNGLSDLPSWLFKIKR